ncbi:MAG TPA: hypothetical protein P5081_05020 [Phycisphaerae bacterium]|nr:hypothetical protein [Phycisphaerae bacterium]HRW52226.1 hypothetical protein [Phycisphaerae bacterium]
MPRPTIAFLPSHPAQLWLMRPVAERVRAFADPVWIVRDKDCLLDLARAMNLEFDVISAAQRSLLKNATTLAADIIRAGRLQRRRRIDCWFTKYGAACIAARLTGRRSVAFNDDDADVVPLIAATAYPFANTVLATHVTRMGRYERRSRRFRGNFELLYLHPDRFTPDRNVVTEAGIDARRPYILIRLSALTAHHDVGQRGVSEDMLRKILAMAEDRFRVYISSEKPLAPEFESFRLPIPAERMHHALAFASLLLGDSQTMTSEAAVLGTPSVRISSFVGRLSYLDELERCELSFGFAPGREGEAFDCVRSLLATPNSEATFQARRLAFLEACGDPLPWVVEQIRSIACKG